MQFNSLKTAIAKLKKTTIAEQEPYYGAAVCQPDGMWKLKCGNRPDLNGLYTEEKINEIDARPDTRIFAVRLHREGYAGPDKPNYLDGKID